MIKINRWVKPKIFAMTVALISGMGSSQAQAVIFGNTWASFVAIVAGSQNRMKEIDNIRKSNDFTSLPQTNSKAVVNDRLRDASRGAEAAATYFNKLNFAGAYGAYSSEIGNLREARRKAPAGSSKALLIRMDNAITSAVWAQVFASIWIGEYTTGSSSGTGLGEDDSDK